MKRMKQLEEETSMLRSGLAMVESARDWYLKQLASVSDKQAMLGKVTYNVGIMLGYVNHFFKNYDSEVYGIRDDHTGLTV